MDSPALFPLLHQLYQASDHLSTKLAALHANRLQCRRGCSSCCVDKLTVFSLEAQNIRQHYPDLLEHVTPHAAGSCAFLNEEGACRIYTHRPLVCRTQGLPLSWQIEEEDGSAAELRDICPLNDACEPLESLAAAALFPVSPFEEKLALLQLHFDGGTFERVKLRDLFTAHE